jgi:hypothetical protein
LDAPATDPALAPWRRIHRAASLVLAALAIMHSLLTSMLYDSWSPDALWFLGTGLGLALLAAMNLAQLAVHARTLLTARVLFAANWAFVVFGLGALIAVPEPQAAVIVAALVIQAVSSHRTLRRSA